jgi:ferredoxin/flavodoxin---NADP+ reductase
MFREATILRRTVWAPGLVSLVLEGQTPTFVPGQFFQLGVRAEGGELVRRSYSAASAPGQPLEFLLSEVTDGALTPRLCALEPGDALELDDTPLGFFTLAEVPTCETLWLLATGTGLGPFLSMLRANDGLERFSQVIVVHGAPSGPRLAYADEVRALCAPGTPGPRKQYIPCVSRDNPVPDALRGRITGVLESGELEGRAGTSIDPNAHVLLCGNPAMIDDMVKLLRARGLEKHRRRAPGHFNFEKYWS